MTSFIIIKIQNIFANEFDLGLFAEVLFQLMFHDLLITV